MSIAVKSFFRTDLDQRTNGIGLLLLRVLAGVTLFAKHGLDKLTGYSAMVQHFPDPVHIGAHASLAFALFSDGICSLLIVLGLATRPAALVVVINLLTVFFFVRHLELVIVYIAAFAAILITGPGPFSLDAKIRG